MSDLKKLYGILSQDSNYKIGSEKEFVQKFSDSTNLRKLYDVVAKDEKYSLGEWEPFYDKFGVKKKGGGKVSQEPASVSSTPPSESPLTPEDKFPFLEGEQGLPSMEASSTTVVRPPTEDTLSAQGEFSKKYGIAPEPAGEFTPPDLPKEATGSHAMIRNWAAKRFEQNPDMQKAVDQMQANEAIYEQTGKDLRSGLTTPQKQHPYERIAEKSEFASTALGFLRGVNEGVASTLKSLDGAERAFYDAIGMESSDGWFGKAAEFMDKSLQENWPEADNNTIIGKLTYDIGHMTPFFGELMITPKIGKIGQLENLLTTKGFTQAYRDADIQKELGADVSPALEGLYGAGMGLKDAYMFHMLGYASSKVGGIAATAAKSGDVGVATTMLANGLGFAGYGALDQYITTGEIDPKLLSGDFALGVALGAPGMMQQLGNKAVNNYYGADPVNIGRVRQLRMNTVEMRDMAFDYRQQAEKATSVNEKARYLSLARAFDSAADIKAYELVVVRDPEGTIKSINENKSLSEAQKERMINRVEEAVGYRQQLELTKDLSKAEETLSDSPKKPVEPSSTKSEGKVPPEGEKPSEKPKSKLEEVKGERAAFNKRTIELLDSIKEEGGTDSFIDAMSNVEAKAIELRREGRTAESSRLQGMIDEIKANKYIKKLGENFSQYSISEIKSDIFVEKKGNVYKEEQGRTITSEDGQPVVLRENLEAVGGAVPRYVGEGVRGAEGGPRYAPIKEVSIPDAEASVLAKTNKQYVFDDAFYEINKPKDFHEAISASKVGNKYAAAVFVYDIADYGKYRLFVTKDGKAGVALTPEGDIVSVFSHGEGKGRAPQLVLNAIREGGKTLDHYDTFLTDYYADFGFKPVARTKWNDKYAPEGWDKETFKKFNNGEPDVVSMVYEGGNPKTLHERVGKFKDVRPELEKLPYSKSYEDALKVRDEYLKTKTNEIKEKGVQEEAPKTEEVKPKERAIPYEVEGPGPPKPPKEPPSDREMEPPPEPRREKTELELLSDRIAAREEVMTTMNPTLKQRFRRFVDEQIVDVKKPAKDRIMRIGKKNPKAARRLVNRMITEAGAAGQSKVEVEAAAEKVFGWGRKTMSNAEQKVLGEVLSLTRTVELGDVKESVKGKEAILTEMKHEGGITPGQSKALLEKIWAKDPETMKRLGVKDYDVERLKEAQESYYETLREQLNKLYNNGVISEGLFNKLRKEQPEYSPRLFLEHYEKIDAEGSISGIKPLAGGSTEAALVDPYTLMVHTINRTNALIHRNRTLKEVSRFAEAVENEYMKNAPTSQAFKDKMKEKEALKEIAETPEEMAMVDKFITPEFADTPKGMTAVDYSDGGIRKRLWIDKEIWKYMEHEAPGERYADALNKVSWLTGTPMLKLAATGMNPEFAIKNLPIDALHVLMTTKLYSNFLPKASAQLTADYRKVASDAWNKTGRYLEYAEEGGLMDFLTTQGKVPLKYGKYNRVTTSVKSVGNSMAALGEFSEVLTRLAVRERAMNNAIKELRREPTMEELKEIKRDATAQARDYLDFSQGGNVSKLIDKFIPYLNAGVQVTRGSLRAAANNRTDFGIKMSQIVGVATALTAWNIGHNPGGNEEERLSRRNAYMNDITPGVKARNFIIMTNMRYEDKNGSNRYIYFKIPKDALQSSITSLAEDIYTKRTLGGDAVKIMNNKMFIALKNEMRNITDLGNLPPAWRAYVGAKSNYDDFYGRFIWTGSDQPKDPRTGEFYRSEEYYPGITPERYVRFGELTGRSPVRTQYIMKQFFTESNIFVSVLGELLDGFVVGQGENTQNLLDKSTTEKVFRSPFVRRVAKTTYPQAAGNIEAMQLQDNAQRTSNNHALDELIQAGDGVEAVLNDDSFNQFMEDIAEDYGYYEAERLMDRAKEKWMKDGVSSPIIRLKYLSPEVRARAFNELIKQNPDMEERYWEEIVKLKLNSERFNTEVGRLQDEAKTGK